MSGRALAAVVAAAVVALAYTVAAMSQPPPVFVINLDRSTDRLRSFTRAYVSSDAGAWSCERLRAVDGRRVEWTCVVSDTALPKLLATEASGMRLDHPDLTAGAVGCYLSHLGAWRRIAESPHPWGLVFEDDASVPADFRRTLDEHMRHLPSDWDIFLLGYQAETRPTRAGTIVSIPSSFFGLFAYMITAKAASRLLQTSSVMPMRQQLDWELSSIIRAGDLKVYAPANQICPHTWQGTNVQTPLAEDEPL